MNSEKQVLINYNSVKMIQNSLRNCLNIAKNVRQANFALELTNIAMLMIHETNDGIFFTIPARFSSYKLVTNGADITLDFPDSTGVINDGFSVITFMLDAAVKSLETNMNVDAVLKPYRV